MKKILALGLMLLAGLTTGITHGMRQGLKQKKQQDQKNKRWHQKKKNHKKALKVHAQRTQKQLVSRQHSAYAAAQAEAEYGAYLRQREAAQWRAQQYDHFIRYTLPHNILPLLVLGIPAVYFIYDVYMKIDPAAYPEFVAWLKNYLEQIPNPTTWVNELLASIPK